MRSQVAYQLTKHWLIVLILLMLAAHGAMAATPAKPAPQSDLSLAYKKEFAFLRAQLHELKQRRTELERRHAQSENQAHQDISNLQGKVVALTQSTDVLAERLSEAERSIESIDASQTALENTLQQAGATLKKHGVELTQKEQPDGELQAQQLQLAFTKATEILPTINTFRRTSGEFFLENGTKVDGEILHMGQIAAYGISRKGSGALAPAGDGRLKIWPQGGQGTAEALAEGDRPSAIQAFLFESLDKPVEATSEKSWLEVVQSGGSIAWAIVALGIAAVALMVLRVMMLKRASNQDPKALNEVHELVAHGQLEQASAKASGLHGSIGKVIATTVKNLHRDRQALEDVVSEKILNEIVWIDRFGTAILVFAAVAPLMGLLGTVTGMISTFDIITEFGTGDPKLLSSGISEALVTTELGLIVAIPTLLVGNLLSGWSKRIKDDMEQASLRVSNVYARPVKSGEAL